ncbi:hypothetical protein GCM10022265_03740 [Marinobacter xestospongiae]
MPTITVRTRADGSKPYWAAVRIKRNGRLVYQESRTFDRKALAKDWAAGCPGRAEAAGKAHPSDSPAARPGDMDATGGPGKPG